MLTDEKFLQTRLSGDVKKHSAPLVLKLSRLLAGTAFGLLASHAARSESVYFDPQFIERKAGDVGEVDLSLFQNNDQAQLPGDYDTALYVNKKLKLRRSISYLSREDGTLEPQITPDILRALGVNVDAFPALKNHQPDTPLGQLAQYIPAADVKFDFFLMQLNFSIPQAAIVHNAQDYIDPTKWDDGAPALFSNYSYSGGQRSNRNGSDDSSQYLNLQSGFNAGPWRVRNYTTYSNSGDEQRWDTISTYVERDIKALKSKFQIGENSTSGEILSNVPFSGVQLFSDDNMLPNSQRGFAPTIRGVANSNAEVTIRQNDHIIYQSFVPPGAFEINDLYPSSYSGNLEITVKEADGTERRFNQPFSAIPIMQRPGRLKYTATAGVYRATNADEKEPTFAQGTAIYGFSNTITTYGGSVVSEDYLSALFGLGYNLQWLGGISADFTHARTTLDNHQTTSGQSYRVQYSKNIEMTDTNFSLASYRYSSAGYYDFDESTQHIDEGDTSALDYHKRSKVQFNINQTLWDGASLYLSGYEQDYWNNSGKEKNLSLGFNHSVFGISYNLSYSYSKLQGEDDDQQVSLNVRIPLSRWLPQSWATYNVSNQKGEGTRHQVGLSGTALDDRRLSYSMQQSYTDQDSESSSNLYSSYRSSFGNLNAGYNYSQDSQQFSYGIAGGIVAHAHGITLSQPLGESFALIDTNGASGARLQNLPGVRTDWRGFAVVPYLTAYNENRIAMDTTTLPGDVDIENTSATVIPNSGAMVTAHFDARVGARVLVTLVRSNGATVPFGAVATTEKQSNIVDEGGVVYLSGIPLEKPVLLHVKWGNAASQQCQAQISLSASTAQVNSLTTKCI
ncbi:Outer membrane usher protein fimD precursor [Campylobacter jejuni]|nr:Outer membrane usher protein fimD precursor [Campylobacter jejuni]